MSIGKWRILSILVIGAGLAAALPFQRAGQRPRGGPSPPERSDFVWRRSDTRPEVAAQTGRSSAEELFIHQFADETPATKVPFPQVQRPASLDRPSPPPQLPATYEPSLEPAAESVFGPVDGRSSAVESLVVRHRIVDGDTLAQLAARYLGSQDRWPDIFEENRDVLESPDLLPIDQELVIVVRKSEG